MEALVSHGTYAKEERWEIEISRLAGVPGLKEFHRILLGTKRRNNIASIPSPDRAIAEPRIEAGQ
jgi:hypothetical protein